MTTSRFLSLTLLLAAAVAAPAKTRLHLSPDVTTFIVMPEPVKLVDISSDKVAGDQCADNIVRVKPFIEADGEHGDYSTGEQIATVTIVGERHMAQIDLVYTPVAGFAQSMYIIDWNETIPYINPEVSMPQYEMARYAWAVYGSDRKYNNIASTRNGIRASVNNIYSVGDYFFIDFSLDNKTNIPYDIEEVRVKLTDKKEVKATNAQTTELYPVYSLNIPRKFKKHYRNVLVLDRLTYPDEKVLSLEISESQISGRTVTLNIEYDDILNADGFDGDILRNLPANYYVNNPLR